MISDDTSSIRKPAQAPPGHSLASVEGRVAATGWLACATKVQVAPASPDSAMRVRIECWSGTPEYAIAPPGAPAR